MQIIALQWGNEAQSIILVTLASDAQATVPWPTQTWAGPIIQAAIDGGMPIAAAPAPVEPPDFSNLDNVERGLKALGLVTATWSGKTVVQLKSAFKSAWDSLT